jgi:hypothetical protein
MVRLLVGDVCIARIVELEAEEGVLIFLPADRKRRRAGRRQVTGAGG